MSAMPDDLELSEAELVNLTKYRRPSCQMAFLKRAGIPATLRRDNTVLVLRMHLHYPSPPAAANDAPRLKSSRK
jgi:hypothetical protein